MAEALEVGMSAFLDEYNEAFVIKSLNYTAFPRSPCAVRGRYICFQSHDEIARCSKG
jgi:hypothetical protein